MPTTKREAMMSPQRVSTNSTHRPEPDSLWAVQNVLWRASETRRRPHNLLIIMSSAPAAATTTTAAPATATNVPPLPLSRLAGIGLIIFFANAALLVLQLVAGRLLAPFIGSSLETWTSIIGVFLLGIALGNAFGGRIADRYPSPRTLAILLGIAALAAIWMVVFPWLLASGGVHKSIP